MAFSVRCGEKKRKKHNFKMAPDMLAVRLHNGQSFDKVLRKSHSPRELASLQEVARAFQFRAGYC